MQAFTIEQDKAVRAQLKTLAAQLRKRYHGTVWQGDFENATTEETFGDRLQVPTEYTTKNGEKFLLVLNLLVAQTSGGALSARVSAWRMTDMGIMGSWPVTKVSTSKKGGRFYRTYLTPQGFIEKIGASKTHFDIVRRLPNVLTDAKKMLDAGTIGNPVQTIHTDRDGDNPYDTTESHLLVFGGYEGAGKRLTK